MNYKIINFKEYIKLINTIDNYNEIALNKWYIIII